MLYIFNKNDNALIFGLQRGKTPEDYSNCSCAIHLACIKKAIEEFDLEVFLEETDFEEVFFAAIKVSKELNLITYVYYMYKILLLF